MVDTTLQKHQEAERNRRIDAIRQKAKEKKPLTEREKVLLNQYVEEEKKNELEKILQNIPVSVFWDAINRNKIADSNYKTKIFFEKLNCPVPLDQKKKNPTFSIHDFFDWFLGDFLPGRTEGQNQKDETIKASTFINNPHARELLQIEYVQVQIEEKKLKNNERRKELVEASVFSKTMLELSEIFHRFGEKLKLKNQHELLEDFNYTLDRHNEKFHQILDSIIPEEEEQEDEPANLPVEKTKPEKKKKEPADKKTKPKPQSGSLLFS
jgi:hypothetical protein